MKKGEIERYVIISESLKGNLSSLLLILFCILYLYVFRDIMDTTTHERKDYLEFFVSSGKGGRYMKKNLLVAQSGGPSAAINATLCGVVEMGLANEEIGKIYGVRNGIMGLLSERLVELDELLAEASDRQLLCQTPSSVLGSCRMKLSPWEESTYEYEKVLAVLQRYNIGYFVFIGGGDSMDTVGKLAHYCKEHHYDIKIVGAPKTIDNDLEGTDHAPGFGSAAKYIGTTFSEIACDCNVYALPSITIVEIMGHDAGWLTAASALARINEDGAPDLIYLCEKPFSIDRFLFDVREKMMEKRSVIVAVSEGLRDEEGTRIVDILQEQAVEALGYKVASGIAQGLEEIVRQEIGCKVRGIELNLMQRCASHAASLVDIEEAKRLGYEAAAFAVKGGTGEMACLRRISNEPYETEVFFVPVEEILGRSKQVPLEWINMEGNDITQEMMDYLLPLIQGELPCTYHNGVPVHFHLPTEK